MFKNLQIRLLEAETKLFEIGIAVLDQIPDIELEESEPIKTVEVNAYVPTKAISQKQFFNLRGSDTERRLAGLTQRHGNNFNIY